MKKWRAVFYMAPITREQVLKNALASSRIEWGWSHQTDPCRLPPPDGRQRRCPHLGCLNFCLFTADYHLTTTVQWCCKMSKKPVVTTNNRLFLVLGAAVQNQQILRFNASLYRPVVVLRLNTYFQLHRFISCIVKIGVLSSVSVTYCSKFLSLLNVVFCIVELRLLSDAQLS